MKSVINPHHDQTTDGHSAVVIPYDSEVSREDAVSMALSMYIGDPCRICGVAMTAEALRAAKWAGESADKKTSIAHGDCWATHRDNPSIWCHA